MSKELHVFIVLKLERSDSPKLTAHAIFHWDQGKYVVNFSSQTFTPTFNTHQCLGPILLAQKCSLILSVVGVEDGPLVHMDIKAVFKLCQSGWSRPCAMAG